ncbi:MAG TPA: response regulator [Deltaproteobacteria bacterium]|nr:response regulator [Deltaproteobacteria bacterium]
MRKILLVEDDELLQVLIRDELMDEGYEVVTARNGIEAMSLLTNSGHKEPDLIIMDIRMPKMDGIDTMGHILKSRLEKPVIIHSAYSGYRENPLTMAADAYLVKSHDFSQLKATVCELLDARRDEPLSAGVA